VTTSTTVRRHRQRGAASLFVALILLLGGTIIAFFANRGFIFEQRTSANQYRSTKAFELAEAGAEWALGRLNENMAASLPASCIAAGATTYRECYATPVAAGATSPVSGTACTTTGVSCLLPANQFVVGCSINASGVATCLNPDVAVDTSVQDRFGVRIRAGGDPSTIEIVARGCTNGTDVCDPAATAAADSTAVVRILAKVVPAVPSGPAAALTTGSATVTGGNMTVVNHNQTSNGITIHAGTTVNLDGSTQVYSLPGTPPRSSILDNDPSLADLTNASEDAFFANYFGQTLTNYRDVDPDVIRLGPSVPIVANRCSNAQQCGDRVLAIIAAGAQSPRFFVYGDISFNGGTLGAQGNPIVLVTDGNAELRGNMTAYGLFYSASATAVENWEFSGSGGATIFGAFISRGNFDNGSGTMRLIYDPSLWGAAAPPVGRLIRVPGSWRDKLTEY
jgi:Tfp pilus assembly protein PilX